MRWIKPTLFDSMTDWIIQRCWRHQLVFKSCRPRFSFVSCVSMLIVRSNLARFQPTFNICSFPVDSTPISPQFRGQFHVNSEPTWPPFGSIWFNLTVNSSILIQLKWNQFELQLEMPLHSSNLFQLQLAALN